MDHFQDADEQQRQEVLKIVRLLLRYPEVEVNATDLRGGLTPLFYAANSGCKEAVEMLLDHGADPEVEIEGQSIKEVVEEHLPGFEFQQYADKVRKRPIKQKVFDCVETNDVNGLKRLAFVHSKNENIDWNWNNGATTLLQLACIHGNEKAVEFLLQNCDPNLTTATEGRTPALIAAHHGYFKVLDILKQNPRVNFKQVEKGTGKTVLHEVFMCDSAKNIFQEGDRPKASYAKSLKVLLGKSYANNPSFERQIDSIINYQEDLEGNTALHYATMQADQDIIKLFLRRGANMGVKNFREKTPVQNILPDTLKEFLDDECIKSEGIITDEEFKITFKYDFLAPPILNEEMLSKYQQEDDQERRALPETEALWYLSTASKDHRALLKHPVISSFLWLKWQRIRTIFYFNILMYLCFVTLLTTFIFLQFGGYAAQPGEMDKTSSTFNSTNESAILVLKIIITCLLVILSMREVFQMFVSFKRYFFNPENLMELTIIILSFIIMFAETDFEMKRHLAALCILFSWCETLVMIGRHPKLSTNVTMFTTVVTTFFGFLLWYGIIIVAFAISFYIMMHEDHKDSEPNEEYIFFDSMWLTLVKTSAMFVGEMEFADLPFTENVISYLVFLAFIFLIVVVLMNLLNGLAVSDTGLIREEAEVVGWSSRVELITYIESMLLGDPFYFLSNWPPIKLLQKIPSCAVCRFLYKFPRVRDALLKVSGGTKILLFYTCLPTKSATFYPNKKSRKNFLNYKKSMKVDDDQSANGAKNRQKLAISLDVLDYAKKIILDQKKSEREALEANQKSEEINNRLLVIEEMLLRLLNDKSHTDP